jgi:hypothetical protein
MSRNTKIVLIVAAAVLLVLCFCALMSVWVATVVFRNASFTASPARIETSQGPAVRIQPGQPDTTGGDIANFTLPEGWRSEYAMKIAGFQLAGYKPDSGTGHIVFALIPETSSTSTEDLAREIQSLAGSQGYRWNQTKMNVVERKPVTVHDQASQLVISEGSSSSGAWREAMTTYRGAQGLVLVIYGMPRDAYDQGEVDALLASIH